MSSRESGTAEDLLRDSLALVAQTETCYDEWGFEVNNSEASSVPETSRSEKKERECAGKWKKWTSSPAEWERVLRKRPGKMRDRVCHGVPRSVRGQVWWTMVHADKVQGMYAADYYQQLLCQPSPVVDAIDKDITRTFRGHELFATRYGDGQKMLCNILRAYSIYDPELGYCQGMSEIAAVLVMMMAEEEAFWVLVQLLADPKYAMRELFLPGMNAIQTHFHVHARLVEQHLPKLHDHFEAIGMQTVFYATKWFMSFFSGVLPFEYMVRVWDVIMFDGTEILYTVALRTLELMQKGLLAMSFADATQHLASLKRIGDYVDSVDDYLAAVTRHPLPHAEIAQLRLEATMEQFKTNAQRTPAATPKAVSPATSPSTTPPSTPPVVHPSSSAAAAAAAAAAYASAGQGQGQGQSHNYNHSPGTGVALTSPRLAPPPLDITLDQPHSTLTHSAPLPASALQGPGTTPALSPRTPPTPAAAAVAATTHPQPMLTKMNFISTVTTGYTGSPTVARHTALSPAAAPGTPPMRGPDPLRSPPPLASRPSSAALLRGIKFA